mgnify:FL=1
MVSINHMTDHHPGLQHKLDFKELQTQVMRRIFSFFSGVLGKYPCNYF